MDVLLFQISDPVNYTTHRILLSTKVFEKPMLQIVYWFSLQTHAAQFSCEYKATNYAHRSLLFMKTEGSNKLQHIRTSIRESMANFVKQDDLIWLNLPVTKTSTSFYCYVVNTSKVGQDDHKKDGDYTITDLSGSVYLSNPISGYYTDSGCPTPPKITVTPELTRVTPPLGSRLDTTCSLSHVHRDYTVRLYLRKHNMSSVICTCMPYEIASTSNKFSENGGLCFISNHQNHTCNITSPSDNQLKYYPAVCSRESVDLLKVNVKLEFPITKLRLVDFGMLVYCETIDPYTTDSGTERQQSHTQSSYYCLRFKIPSQINRFVYRPISKSWLCDIVSYPVANATSIRVIAASPEYLKMQISGYRLERQEIVCASHNVQQKRQDKCSEHLTLRRLSLSPYPGENQILVDGQVEVVCQVGNSGKYLNTKIDSEQSQLENKLVPVEVTSKSKPVFFTCQFTTDALDRPRRISLHRFVNASWIAYDFTIFAADINLNQTDPITTSHFSSGFTYRMWSNKHLQSNDKVFFSITEANHVDLYFTGGIVSGYYSTHVYVYLTLYLIASMSLINQHFVFFSISHLYLLNNYCLI